MPLYCERAGIFPAVSSLIFFVFLLLVMLGVFIFFPNSFVFFLSGSLDIIALTYCSFNS